MAQSYLSLLRENAQAHRSIVCFGLDPDINKIPATIITNSTEEKITKFYSDIIDSLPSDKSSVSALKPNYAWFAQYGFDGLRALKALIDKYRGNYTIIFDGKRGDIGTSSEAYAREAFDFFGAHALTVSPYMGEDSVKPFIKRCSEGRGIYILCRTSNSGASDFQSQDMALTEKPLYISVAKKALEWHADGVGLVIGATNTDELEGIYWAIEPTGKEVPFLIPGVGAQGGSAADVAKTLRSVASGQLLLHRINASSSIAYAWQKKETSDYVGAALSEIDSMNRAIALRI